MAKRLYHDHGVYDGLGNPILSRVSAELAQGREPLVSAPPRRCAWPAGCLRDRERGDLCVGHWEELHPHEAPNVEGVYEW